MEEDDHRKLCATQQVQSRRSTLGYQEEAAPELGSKAQRTFSEEEEEEGQPVGGNNIRRSKEGHRPVVCWGTESWQLLREGGWEDDGGDSCARSDHGVWSLAFMKCQGGAGVLRDAEQWRNRSSLALKGSLHTVVGV